MRVHFNGALEVLNGRPEAPRQFACSNGSVRQGNVCALDALRRLARNPASTSASKHGRCDWRHRSGFRRYRAGGGRTSPDAVVARAVYAVPPRVEYAITELGRTAIEPIDALRTWGRLYRRRADTEPPAWGVQPGAAASWDERRCTTGCLCVGTKNLTMRGRCLSESQTRRAWASNPRAREGAFQGIVRAMTETDENRRPTPAHFPPECQATGTDRDRHRTPRVFQRRSHISQEPRGTGCRECMSA